MKMLCWYLQGIKENGLVFNPSKKLVVDCYADADFAGLWGHENPRDPIFTRSRTGFVIAFSNCLYRRCKHYSKILRSLHYIMSMWHCLVLL